MPSGTLLLCGNLFFSFMFSEISDVSTQHVQILQVLSSALIKGVVFTGCFSYFTKGLWQN